tara:strand:+ start:2696 stop:2917 length:222 start_codon:yes stop_codon:yes gene_type:complete
MKDWEYEKKDNIMYYFNRILRPSYYKTNIKHKCIDHCHDCVAMIKLLTEYPENEFSKQSVSNMVETLLRRIKR